MKRIVLLFLVMVTTISLAQQKGDSITKIILVRHAEKANDATKDPSLSEVGQNRAKRLAEMLKDVLIDEAYSTPYKRTTQTLGPLCEAKNIEIKPYEALNPALIEETVKDGSHKTIIVAGHSNTVPLLVNKLIKENKFSEMDENDYGKLWVLTFQNNQLMDITLFNY